jgi:hypothetical protein
MQQNDNMGAHRRDHTADFMARKAWREKRGEERENAHFASPNEVIRQGASPNEVVEVSLQCLLEIDKHHTQHAALPPFPNPGAAGLLQRGTQARAKPKPTRHTCLWRMGHFERQPCPGAVVGG